jgi:hypothetical protein
LTGDCATALAETVSSLSSVIRPSLTARNVTYVVMILVIEAGYHGAVAFSACSTLPVSTSTRITDSAAAREAARLTVTQVASAKISVRPMVDSFKNITYAVRFLGGLRNHVPPLVSRFRSSYGCAALSFTNFGIEGH